MKHHHALAAQSLIALSASSLLLVGCGGGHDGGDGGSGGSTTGGSTTGSSVGGTSGGGSSPGAACVSMHDAGGKLTTSIDAGCANCSITNPANAADSDFTTFATLSVNNAAAMQGASIRSTARSGLTFPAGQMAGAFVSVPSGTAQSYTVTIRTYLAGVLQESNGSDNSGGAGGVTGGHPSAFDGITTTKAFDAVEVFVNNTQASGTPNFGVYELCSDHHA